MSNAIEIFRSLEQRLLAAETERSAVSLEELLAPDFREFGTGGRIHLRADVLGHPRNPGAVAFEVGAFTARQLSDEVALTTYEITARDRESGRTSRSLRSSVWRREQGRWQVIFHQATRIDPAQP